MIARKLPVMDVVRFRRLPEKSQATFANNLKVPKKPKSDNAGGGNYWTRGVSGVSKSFKNNDNSFIQEKIDDVARAYDTAKTDGTRTMYKRNLEILHAYIGFDFSTWRPSPDLEYLDNPQLTLLIKDLPIQVGPNHVFSYDDNGVVKVGGIWFVCWLDGFKAEDLGIFSESLFRYLSFLYSKKYKVEPDNCFIVDISNMERFTYQQILDGKIDPMLENTIDMIVKYL